jgi:hypothetical protein
MKKINDEANQNNDNSNTDDPFAGFAVHICKAR